MLPNYRSARRDGAMLLWRFDHGALIEGQENDYDQHNYDCNRDKPLSSHREPFDDNLDYAAGAVH